MGKDYGNYDTSKFIGAAPKAIKAKHGLKGTYNDSQPDLSLKPGKGKSKKK